MGFTFDYTISLADLIEAAGLIATMVWLYAKMDKRISMLERSEISSKTEITELKQLAGRLTDAVHQQAVVSERLVTIVERLQR